MPNQVARLPVQSPRLCLAVDFSGYHRGEIGEVGFVRIYQGVEVHFLKRGLERDGGIVNLWLGHPNVTNLCHVVPIRNPILLSNSEQPTISFP